MTLAEHLDQYNQLNHKWSDKTKKNNKTAINFWSRELGEWDVDMLTPSLVATARNLIDAKALTKNRYMSVLSGALEHAVQQGLREDNPCRALEPLTGETHKRTPLSKDEQKTLLDYLSIHYPALHELTYLALLTGAQRIELEHLCWGDIDFDRRLLTVQPHAESESRIIPVGTTILNLFTDTARRIGRQNIYADALIFEPLSRYKWQRALDRTLMRSIDFRDLRHTFIVEKLSEGHSLALIARYTGSKGVINNRSYLELTINDVRGMVD